LKRGRRRGELLDLRWEYVDLRLCVAYLPLTKNFDNRDGLLSRRAVKTLLELRAVNVKDERVLPLSGNAVRHAVEHLRARAGMSDLRIHDLRHQAISRLFERGLNMIELRSISGYREPKMLAGRDIAEDL